MSSFIFYGTPGDDHIYFNGDIRATVPDDTLRGDIIQLLNAKMHKDDVDDEIIEMGELCKTNNINEARLHELLAMEEVHKTNGERFDQIMESMKSLLGEELTDHEVDVINACIEELKQVDVPKPKKKRQPKSKNT